MPIASTMGGLFTTIEDNYPKGTERASLLDDAARALAGILKTAHSYKIASYASGQLTLGAEGGVYTASPNGNITSIVGSYSLSQIVIVFVNTTAVTLAASATVVIAQAVSLKAGDAILVHKAPNGVFYVDAVQLDGALLDTRITALEARGTNSYTSAALSSGVLDLGTDPNIYKVISGSGNITSVTGGVAGTLYHLVTDTALTMAGVVTPNGEPSITMLKGDSVILECASGGGYYVKAYTRQQYNNFSAVVATGLDAIYNGEAQYASGSKYATFPVTGNQLCLVKVRLQLRSSQLNTDESVWCYAAPSVTAGSLVTSLPFQATLQGGNNCNVTHEFSFFARAGNGNAGITIGSGGGATAWKNLQVACSIEIVKLTD